MKLYLREPRRNSGFTLIELLVVVTIIIILIAILVPSLAAAKRRAKTVEATSQLTGISTACEQYFHVFDTYPGPANAVDTTAGTLTGTQNLLLGLGYAMYTTSGQPPAGQPNPPIAETPLVFTSPSTSTVYVDASCALYVQDFSSKTPAGVYKTYNAFYAFGQKGLSPAVNGGTTWYNGGVKGVAGAPWAFPTIVDTFNDPLPILYYRRNPNVEGTADTNSNGVATAQPSAARGGSPIAASGAAPISPIPSYYFDENKPYTASSNLISPSGSGFPQNGFTTNLLATDACNVQGTIATSRGGYVLISAGPDRVYGNLNSKTDDIVIVGGH